MNKVKLPPQVCGKWIWLKDYNKTDTFLLFRKEFNCELLENSIDVWISANTAYQLFINDKLVGFGPCGHHRPDSCFIDQHNIDFFVEPGSNVIAVKVFYDKSGQTDRRQPGFWCQMASGSNMMLFSDESWLVAPLACSGCRPAVAPQDGKTEICRAGQVPENWQFTGFKMDALWQTPDLICSIENFPLRPELFPLQPPVITPEPPEFSACGTGRVGSLPFWTGVRFPQCGNSPGKTFVAAGYVFVEEPRTVHVELFSDDPFKIYCNSTFFAEAEYADGLHAEFTLSAGWNRILLFQTPGIASMGFLMTFAGDQDLPVVVKQDTIESADNGWLIAGPLRLQLHEVTPSLRFDRLCGEYYSCHFNTVPCVEVLLGKARFESIVKAHDDELFTDGECKVWKLPKVGYGFVEVSVTGSAGDIVDIAISPDCRESGFPGNGKKRCVHTLLCRDGVSTFQQFVPGDCVYAAVFVRHTQNGIGVESVQFKELRKDFFREATFHCSDDFLNDLWESGRQAMHRSASIVPLADSRKSQDVYLFDAYVHAVDSTVVFGDSGYLTIKLRQFLDCQLENGCIPVVTHGNRRERQIHHMLFLPQWILQNYSFSGSQVELEKSLTALDCVRGFFEAMLDPEYGMLKLPANWLDDDVLVEQGRAAGSISSCISALFCRFLLSAADVYRINDNRKADAARCITLANSVAGKIRHFCQNAETGLFKSWADVQENDKPDFFTNFCALYGGVLQAEHFEKFFFEFFNYDPPFEKFDGSTPYFCYLFTETMFACRQRKWIFRYWLDYWKKHFDPERGHWLGCDGKTLAGTELAHGEMISPNIFIIREILGIRYCGLGQQILYFHPGIDFVEHAEGAVPLANGRLLVKWERTADGGLDVTLDSSVPVTIMPEISPANLAKIAFALGEQVTMLQPPADFEDDLEF